MHNDVHVHAGHSTYLALNFRTNSTSPSNSSKAWSPAESSEKISASESQSTFAFACALTRQQGVRQCSINLSSKKTSEEWGGKGLYDSILRWCDSRSRRLNCESRRYLQHNQHRMHWIDHLGIQLSRASAYTIYLRGQLTRHWRNARKLERRNNQDW